MSHQIPDSYRYVSSITIDNAGSGYTDIPTITITGGGGTGAAASATIFNGQIQAVTVTSIGRDYTTAPTVTFSSPASGTTATGTAQLAFASDTPSDYNEKSSLDVKYTLPEFIRDDHTKFVTFIEKYFEYMDDEGNPNNLLLNKKYNDIDDFNDTELHKKALELAKNFPQVLETDRKTLYKKINDIYETKGSERSIKAYFKLLYNEEVEVFYPSKNVLRTSDGVWIEEKSVSAIAGYNDYEVLDLNGKEVDIRYYETIGSVTLIKNIPVTISRVEKIAYSFPQAYELVLKLPPNTTTIPGAGSQAVATATIVAGEITEITVTSGGFDYTAAPEVTVFSTSGGSGAVARAVVSNGAVTSIVVTDGGSGYSDASTTVQLNTENVRSFIVDRDATNEEENIRAYLQRSLSSVTSATYSGADAGFSIGDVFFVNETGDDGRGYAITGYFAGDYTFLGGANNAVIRVATIDSSNVPTSWSIISSGDGFFNAETTITIQSKTGEDLDINLFTDYLYQYDGKYKDDRGKLSDVNRIQDNYKYQAYSYIIKSGLSQNTWVKNFKEVIHPAGMEVFGDLIISKTLDYSSIVSYEVSGGLDIDLFKTQDTTLNVDVVEIAITINVADTVSSADVPTIEVTKPIDDTATSSDVGAVEMQLDKSISDTSSTLDVFVPVLSWTRSFTDTSTATDNFQSQVTIGRNFSETISTSDFFSYLLTIPLDVVETVTASENVALGINPSFTNFATASENSVINISKELTDTPTASESAVFNLQNAFADTGSATDSGVINIQDYADPTYFNGDYVGDGYNF